MFNATTASLSQLRAFAADNNINVEGDRRRQQSYIDSIQAWQSECGCFDVDAVAEDISADELTSYSTDDDISLAELSDELPWEESVEQTGAAACVSLAPLLLLLCQLVLVLLALPIVLTGGLLRALALGIDKLANWLASPKPGRWGSMQALVLAIP